MDQKDIQEEAERERFAAELAADRMSRREEKPRFRLRRSPETNHFDVKVKYRFTFDILSSREIETDFQIAVGAAAGFSRYDRAMREDPVREGLTEGIRTHLLEPDAARSNIALRMFLKQVNVNMDELSELIVSGRLKVEFLDIEFEDRGYFMQLEQK